MIAKCLRAECTLLVVGKRQASVELDAALVERPRSKIDLPYIERARLWWQVVGVPAGGTIEMIDYSTQQQSSASAYSTSTSSDSSLSSLSSLSEASQMTCRRSPMPRALRRIQRFHDASSFKSDNVSPAQASQRLLSTNPPTPGDAVDFSPKVRATANEVQQRINNIGTAFGPGEQHA